MGRRIVHVVLLFAGLAPVVWAVCVCSSDPRRAAVLMALAVLGLSLNGAALARPKFGMRLPLRVIAAGMALIVAAGVLAMYQWLHSQYLPGLPDDDVSRREIAILASHNLIWIAASVGYVLLTLLILPTPPRERSTAKDGGRIDFRTYGR